MLQTPALQNNRGLPHRSRLLLIRPGKKILARENIQGENNRDTE